MAGANLFYFQTNIFSTRKPDPWQPWLYALVWRRAPKELITSTTTVATAAILAAIQNNEGVAAVQNFLTKLNLPVGSTTIGSKFDVQKILQAQRLKINPPNKLSKSYKNSNKNPDYNAGAF